MCFFNPDSHTNIKIAVIGQGYVGVPLALEFAKYYPVYGFDINNKRVKELNGGKDYTKEADLKLLSKVIKQADESNFTRGYIATSNIDEIKNANVFIVTVPTPVDRFNIPDLLPLIKASEMLGGVLSKGDIVIYESTVYPGCTEEDCVPVLEKFSGLKFNQDFYVGYSPERINAGDKINTLTKIKKVTSGSTVEIAELIDQLYQKIIVAGTYKAPSIKVAEAAKVIENAQRDINIAFVNELAKIFNLMDIDIHSVLEAAGTKWNFLPFKPGLVGGHCIGVDPYYLAHKAQEYGYHPEIILAGRRLNDSMGKYVGEQVVKAMIKKDIPVNNADVLMLGVTFKENCPDVRNTKIVDVITALEDFGVKVTTYDPWACPNEVMCEYGIEITNDLPSKKFDAVVLGVAHKEFKNLDLSSLKKDNAVVYDVKGLLKETEYKL